MGRTYAGILGPVAFLTVLARSLLDGDAAASTLQIATGCLFGFAGLGFVAGQTADLIVLDSVRSRFEQELRTRAETSREKSKQDKVHARSEK